MKIRSMFPLVGLALFLILLYSPASFASHQDGVLFANRNTGYCDGSGLTGFIGGSGGANNFNAPLALLGGSAWSRAELILDVTEPPYRIFGSLDGAPLNNPSQGDILLTFTDIRSISLASQSTGGSPESGRFDELQIRATLPVGDLGYNPNVFPSILFSDGLDLQDGWFRWYNTTINTPCIPGESGCSASGGGSFAIDTDGFSGNAFRISLSSSGSWQGFGLSQELSLPITLSAGRRYSISWYWQESGQGCSFSGLYVVGTGSHLTPPVITPNVVGATGTNGWYVGDVMVSWNVTDPESAITATSGCGSTMITSDTAGTTFTCTATSAGGTASNSVTVKRDTGTSVIGSRTPGPNPAGWNNADVTVTFTCSDGLSGIDSCGPTPQVVSGEGAGQSRTGTAVDRAGNSASATVSGINIDKTPPNAPTPSISPLPNAANWNRTGVTVSFVSNGDAGLVQSGVATCTGPISVTIETAGTVVSGTCTDRAENTSAAAPITVKIDQTPPIVTVNTPQSFAVLPVGSILDFAGSDALSGIANVTGLLSDGTTTASVGSGFSVTQTGVYTLVVTATDVAGNVASETRLFVSYDPSAGFATGGGWFVPGGPTSDPGDILPGLDGMSQAAFGFVVKYKPGASVPDGQLQFQYRHGSFDLHSTAMNWLVVNNNWAKFQGTATIKGQSGEFPFRVDARDGDFGGGSQPDRFIIRVWSPGGNPDLSGLIYKGSGDLQGGSIVIHTK